jgi:DNA repair protein RadA/Sms
MDYACSECKKIYTKWAGLCHECNSWNSIIELRDTIETDYIKKDYFRSIDVEPVSIMKVKTGVTQIDDMLEGGFYPGSLSVISGSPGSGKTTLLSSLLKKYTTTYFLPSIYFSTEEPIEQLAKRFFDSKLLDKVFLSNQSDLKLIFNAILKSKSKLVVIDSVQLLLDKDNDIFSYSIHGLRLLIAQIFDFCKKNKVTIVLVSQVVKDGSLAGPKFLEHMVDVVLSLSKLKDDKQTVELSCVKNRFGTNSKKAYFNINIDGISFIQNTLVNYKKVTKLTPGLAYGVFFELDKIIFYEVQALVVKNKSGNNKRVSSNYSKSRLDLIIAIVERYMAISLDGYDIFITIIDTNIKNDHRSDAAVLNAIISSYLNKSALEFYYCGEISLLGKVLKTPISSFCIKYLENKTGVPVIANIDNSALLNIDGNKSVSDVNEYFQSFK